MRDFPKTLIAYFNTSTPSGYSKKFAHKEIVYTKTAYDTFINYWRENRKCLIDERPPKWSELKGDNFFLKIYYALPKWILILTTACVVWIADNWQEVLKFLSLKNK